ncbi:Flp pilus assembly protein TadG [Ahrensia sp. R2A130]|nr:Flp pilus assembly protein TadG [Ahrensia sp. R2A130]
MSISTHKAKSLVQRSRAVLSNTVKRFRDDERGNVFVFTALSLPVMLMAIGAGADYAELYRARVNFQSAVDAGAIAAAKNLAATGQVQTSKDIGEEVFRSNLSHLGEKAVREGQINFDMGDGDCAVQGVITTATLPHDRFFSLSFVDQSQQKGFGANKIVKGQEEFILSASSTVECGNDTIEIALVLDNSGSMRWNGKIGTLRQASNSLVETLHTTMGSANKAIQFSVVPFAATVNVGTNNRNEPWMDTQGRSSTHWEMIDPSTSTDFSFSGGRYLQSNGQALSRFTLYDSLPNTSWQGCVEQRPHPYHTQDDTPSISNPDTLIVPSFAPDTPDNWDNDYNKRLSNIVVGADPHCTRFQGSKNGRRTIRYCNRWSDNRRGREHYTNPSYRPHWDDRIEYNRGNLIRPTNTQQVWEDYQRIDEKDFQNNYLDDAHNFDDKNGADHVKSEANTGYASGNQYKRQEWINKYFTDDGGNRPSVGNSNPLGMGAGPNSMCSSVSVSDLTDNKNTTQAKLTSMQASGATNVQMGVAWGWRTLSPGEPFTEGRPYDAEDNKKIMIIMTDGNNTYYPTNIYGNQYAQDNKSFYGGHGHSVKGRIFDGYDGEANPGHNSQTFTKAMDEHLTETCTNAKNAGITIYSIAFDVPNGSSVKATLEDCASSDVGGGKLYFDANNNAALIDTFEKIAERLADLRISK